MDERCVPANDTESNYGEAKRILFDRMKSESNVDLIPGENIFRIKGENDPAEEADRYAEVLMKELPVENAFPAIDLILLGIGDDADPAMLAEFLADPAARVYSAHEARQLLYFRECWN